MGWLVDRLPASRRMAAVAGGDLLAIALFVAAGELRHGNPVLAGVLTYLEFGAGWVIVAVALGAYRAGALSSPRRAGGLALLAWTVAALVGQIVRLAVEPSAVLAPSFVLVSVGAGGVLLVAWRVAAAWMG